MYKRQELTKSTNEIKACLKEINNEQVKTKNKIIADMRKRDAEFITEMQQRDAESNDEFINGLFPLSITPCFNILLISTFNCYK